MLSKTKLSFLTVILGAALALPACVGQLPGSEGENGGDGDAPDAGVTPEADAGPDVVALSVTGSTRDYQEAINGQIGAIAATELITEGITPDVLATAGADGAFTLTDIPAGSIFYVNASGAGTYRNTRNEGLAVVDQPVTTDLYLVSEPFITQNHTSAGNILAVADTGVVIVDMQQPDGQPLTGVPIAGVVLLDALGEPVLDVLPYFFGPAGTMLPQDVLVVSTLYLGKTRVGFLNVPSGQYTVQVTYVLQDVETVITAPVLVDQNGATLSLVGGLGVAPPAAGPMNFREHIYPDLQRASQGGLTCATCHTAGGTMAALPYDGTPDLVYAAIIAAELIDPVTPENSGLLVNPLYETPPDHPNATFADLNDRYYRKWLLWIQQGYPLDPPL